MPFSQLWWSFFAMFTVIFGIWALGQDLHHKPIPYIMPDSNNPINPI